MPNVEDPRQVELRKIQSGRSGAALGAALQLEAEEQDPDPKPNRRSLRRKGVEELPHGVEGDPTP